MKLLPNNKERIFVSNASNLGVSKFSAIIINTTNVTQEEIITPFFKQIPTSYRIKLFLT